MRSGQALALAYDVKSLQIMLKLILHLIDFYSHDLILIPVHSDLLIVFIHLLLLEDDLFHVYVLGVLELHTGFCELPPKLLNLTKVRAIEVGGESLVGNRASVETLIRQFRVSR